MNALQNVSLETIAGGALKELFQAELTRVLENITDINTDPQQKRSITVNVEFKPGAKRETADVKVKCVSKLAGLMTVNTQVFMGKQNGKLVAVENDPRQGGLFDPDQPRPLAAVAPFTQQPVKEGQ
jgi:hypothetical protein